MSDFQGFDADAAAQSLTPPRLKYDGDVYEGRPLGFKTAVEFWSDINRLDGQTDVDADQLVGRLVEILEAFDMTDGEGQELDAEQFVADHAAATVIAAVMDFLELSLGMDDQT